MEPTSPTRDIAAIILDILRLKEDWKYALRHEDEIAIREHLQAAVNLGHELGWATNAVTLDLIRRAQEHVAALPPLTAFVEDAAKAFADFGSAHHVSGLTTKPSVPMVEDSHQEIDANDPRWRDFADAMQRLRDVKASAMRAYKDDFRAP